MDARSRLPPQYKTRDYGGTKRCEKHVSNFENSRVRYTIQYDGISEIGNTLSVLEMNKKLLRFDTSCAIATFCIECTAHFNAVNIATACHRLAKICRTDKMRQNFADHGDPVKIALGALKTRALALASTFKPQEQGNLFWALAVLDSEPGVELVDVLVKQSLLALTWHCWQ